MDPMVEHNLPTTNAVDSHRNDPMHILEHLASMILLLVTDSKGMKLTDVRRKWELDNGRSPELKTR